MKIAHQNINGELVRGEFRPVSNYTETFILYTKSLSPVDAEVIKRLIEEKYEVLKIEKLGQVIGIT